MADSEKEYISHWAGDKEDWRCSCGNYPSGDGFYACDTDGNKVEPTEKDWNSGLYVCDCCGRMINPDTLEVVGYSRPMASRAFSSGTKD